VLCIFTNNPALRCLERKNNTVRPCAARGAASELARTTARRSSAPRQPSTTPAAQKILLMWQCGTNAPSSAVAAKPGLPELPGPAALRRSGAELPTDRVWASWSALLAPKDPGVGPGHGTVPSPFIPQITHKVLHAAWHNEAKDQRSTGCANPSGSCCLVSWPSSSLQRCSSIAEFLSGVFLLSPQGARGGAAGSLPVVPSGIGWVPGQLTCFHPRLRSSQLLAKSSTSVGHTSCLHLVPGCQCSSLLPASLWQDQSVLATTSASAVCTGGQDRLCSGRYSCSAPARSRSPAEPRYCTRGNVQHRDFPAG